MPTEGAVASFSVVVLQPGSKSRCTVGVAGEDLAVSPLGGQGRVEALHFDTTSTDGGVSSEWVINQPLNTSVKAGLGDRVRE